MAARLLSTSLKRPLASAAPARWFHASARRCDLFANADAQTFEKVVSKTDGHVVLVDFYADWCGPCKMLSPILEKLIDDPSVKSGSGKPLHLVTVDTDAEPQLAQQFQVRSLPTVIAFKDGEPVSQFMGALPEARVRHFLTTL